jgi:hypothetical protein
MTDSKRLTGNRPDISNNDPRFGRRNSNSDDLRADAAVTRPSPVSPLEGRGQAIKAKESGVRPQLAPTVSSAETTSSGCHHLSTDDNGHLRASATSANGGHPRLHRQIPTQVLADGQASTSAQGHRAGVRTRQSKNTNAAHAAYDVLDSPSVRAAQQTPEPRSSGRRRRWRPRQSQLSQRARHAGADGACGRPVPRCRSSPLRKAGECLLP